MGWFLFGRKKKENVGEYNRQLTNRQEQDLVDLYAVGGHDKFEPDSPMSHRYGELEEIKLVELDKRVLTNRSFYLTDQGKDLAQKLMKSGITSKKGGRTPPVFLLIFMLVGIFFLSPSLTGNAIGSLNQTSSNWIGGILFVIGLVASLIYFKRK